MPDLAPTGPCCARPARCCRAYPRAQRPPRAAPTTPSPRSLDDHALIRRPAADRRRPAPFTPEIVNGWSAASASGGRLLRRHGTSRRIGLNSPAERARAASLNNGGGSAGFQTSRRRCPGGVDRPGRRRLEPVHRDPSASATRPTTSASDAPCAAARPRHRRSSPRASPRRSIGAPAESAGTYRVDAIFDTAKGIIPGQLVKIAGARVGSIEDVVLTEDYKARVIMSVPRRFAVPRRRELQHPARGPDLGELRPVRPGHARASETLGGDPAPTVPVERTTVPVSITDLFRVFQADVRQRFTVAIMAIGGGLAARGTDLNNIIRRANPTLAAVRKLVRDLAAQKANLSRRRARHGPRHRRARRAQGPRRRLHRAGRARVRPGRRPARRRSPRRSAGCRRCSTRPTAPSATSTACSPTAGRCSASCARPRPASTACVGQIGPFAARRPARDPAARRRRGHGPAHRPQRRAGRRACCALHHADGPGGQGAGRHARPACATAAASSTCCASSTSARRPRRASTRRRTSCRPTPSTAASAAARPRSPSRAATRSSDNPAARSADKAAQGARHGRHGPRRRGARAGRDRAPHHAGAAPAPGATPTPQLPAILKPLEDATSKLPPSTPARASRTSPTSSSAP